MKFQTFFFSGLFGVLFPFFYFIIKICVQEIKNCQLFLSVILGMLSYSAPLPPNIVQEIQTCQLVISVLFGVLFCKLCLFVVLFLVCSSGMMIIVLF